MLIISNNNKRMLKRSHDIWCARSASYSCKYILISPSLVDPYESQMKINNYFIHVSRIYIVVVLVRQRFLSKRTDSSSSLCVEHRIDTFYNRFPFTLRHYSCIWMRLRLRLKMRLRHRHRHWKHTGWRCRRDWRLLHLGMSGTWRIHCSVGIAHSSCGLPATRSPPNKESLRSVNPKGRRAEQTKSHRYDFRRYFSACVRRRFGDLGQTCENRH